MILHHVHRGAEALHALTKLALNAAAFLLPHLVQSLERFPHGCHHCRLQSSIDSAAGGIQCAGNTKDDVEIGFGGNAELASGRAKSRNVGAHQRTIQSQSLPPPRSRLSVTSTWPRAILSFSRRRSCISMASEPEGRRKCRSRNLWLTDFNESAKATRPLPGAEESSDALEPAIPSD